jgi:pimeloyl-ACP methyl ester carboxylesterase
VASNSLPLGWQFARLPVLGQLTEHFLPRPLVAQGLRAVYGHPERVNDALIDRYFELTLRAGNRAALVQRLQQWSPAEGVDHVRGVTAPTLILWGGQDRLIPLVNGQRLAADIAGSRLAVFDDLGHVPHEEDPARTVAVVKDFLAVPAPAPARP